MKTQVQNVDAIRPEILDRVGFNQVGFCLHGPKQVVVADAGPASFWILDAKGVRRFQSELGPLQQWQADGRDSRRADFSPFCQEGYFVLSIPAYGVQLPLKIDKAPWGDLGKALLKAYYFQRASIELKPEFAGAFARPMGHADTTVLVHASAATEARPEGFTLSSPKGWYDAGDYNKYIVNSGITVWTLLSLAEDFSAYAGSLQLGIPESGQGLPDILAEVKWNLDWMLTMQDPDDGGVYHKLTNLRFDGMVMPDQCQNPRYVVMKTTAASFHFAAVLAQSSRIYAPYDASFGKRCLEQAVRAFSWGVAHPHVPYRQPEDIRTGRYEDEHLEDEKQWAAFELFIATGDASYETMARAITPESLGVPVWQRVGALGVISMALRRNDTWARKQLLVLAEELLERQASNAYRVSMAMEDFVWGSNGMAANQGVVLLVAFLLTKESRFRDAAVHMLDYLVGQNPLRQSFITGFGMRPPMHPHHRPSESDCVVAPVPGLLVGGPNPGRQDAKNCPAYASSAPGMAYLDHLGSYASNEIAINWNAPAAYLAVGLQALFGGGSPTEEP